MIFDALDRLWKKNRSDYVQALVDGRPRLARVYRQAASAAFQAHGRAYGEYHARRRALERAGITVPEVT